MITLHRLGHQLETFQLNPDLIMTVEAMPDTVITLTNGTKVVVAEPPERIVDDVRAHKIEVLAGAMDRRDALRGERTGGRAPIKRAALRVTTPVTPLPLPSDTPASA
jgi:flagellar protein FlbD